MFCIAAQSCDLNAIQNLVTIFLNFKYEHSSQTVQEQNKQSVESKQSQGGIAVLPRIEEVETLQISVLRADSVGVQSSFWLEIQLDYKTSHRDVSVDYFGTTLLFVGIDGFILLPFPKTQWIFGGKEENVIANFKWSKTTTKNIFQHWLHSITQIVLWCSMPSRGSRRKRGSLLSVFSSLWVSD